MTMPFPFDVSIVLNTMSGSAYLIRALRSLEEASQEARGCGLRIELLFVMNQSPPSHWALAEAFTSVHFDDIRMIRVSRSSLGAARQDGIEAACGEYIMFADDDDLISSNSIVVFYKLARTMGPKSILIPRWLIGFGAFHVVAQYLGSDRVSSLSFIKYHPFISRIFFHSSASKNLRFADVPPDKGYGYEDWHFNTNAISLGYKFISAPETILFYRQRAAGLLNQYNIVSVRQIPPSALFVPATYLQICESDAVQFDGSFPPVDLPAIRDAFVHDPLCRRYTFDANQIDPSIDWIQIAGGAPWVNWAGDLRCGAAYYAACRQVVGQTFDHVFLCNSHAKASVIRRMILVAAAIVMIQPHAKILMLNAGVDPDVARALTKTETTVLDLGSLQIGLPPEDIDTMTLRLIENVADKAVLHLFGGKDVRRFFGSYRAILSGRRVIYYRDRDPVITVSGMPSIDGADFDFVAEMLPRLDAVVCDCRYVAERDKARIRLNEERWAVFYTPPIESGVDEHHRVVKSESSMLLLWVVDRSDPPNYMLIGDVMAELAKRGLKPKVDILVEVAPGGRLSCQHFCHGERSEHIGEIETGLTMGDYAGLVYTAPVEHLPTIVIDALANGLPVIALASGGLSEIVLPGKTGWLIYAEDPERLIPALVDSICTCLIDRSFVDQMKSGARGHIAQLCSPRRVHEVIATVLSQSHRS